MLYEPYNSLLTEATSLLQKVDHPIVNAANLSALLFRSLPDLNWVGFYFLNEGALYLGPFQGKPACTRIELSTGVCGRSFVEGRILRVTDVHIFAGHIACDSESNAELVIPLRGPNGAVGVLDLDSPRINRFTQQDEQGLEQIAAAYVKACDFRKAGYTLS